MLVENFKKTLKSESILVVAFLGSFLVRVYRKYICRKEREKSFLVIPASAYGSLGDEAMLLSVMYKLNDSGFKNIWVALYEDVERQIYEKHGYRVLNLSKYFNLETEYLGALPYLKALAGFDYVALIGADVLDGKYSESRSIKRLDLVWLAALYGCKSAIFGFSWNADAVSPRLINRLCRVASKAVLHSRDPASAERITMLTGYSPCLVADLAFSLPITENGWSSKATLWIDERKKNGRIPIVVNLNKNKNANIYMEDAVDFWSSMLTTIFEKIPLIDILFVPHDYRTGNEDTFFMENVIERLEKKFSDRHILINEIITPSQVKTIVSKVDFVLTGRMHLGIAALGVGTPTVFVDYQGKVEGLLTLFDISGVSLDKNYLNSPSTAAKLIYERFNERDALSKKIKSRLPFVHQLSEKNFDFIE